MGLSIQMLGDFALYREGEKLLLPKSKRTRALLAYLALTNKPHRRDRLCDIFWPTPDDPRGALRWSLSKLRHLINDDGSALQADRESIFLSTTNVEIDISTIAEKIKESDITVEKLTSIYYRLEEPFLSGVDLPNQNLFQNWLVSKRNEVIKMQCKVLSRLANNETLIIFDQLAWSYIWLERSPYDKNAANLILTQLAFLGKNSERERLLETLTSRFRRAGIQWNSTKAIMLNGQDNSNDDVSHNLDKSKQHSIKEMVSRQKTKFCITDDKVRLAYATVGKGYPIVKTANWLTHLEYDWEAPIWSPLFRELALEHSFLRYDERGNGLSDWNVKNISFDSFVKDLEAVIQANELERFALLGISQGASVAIEYAVNNPDKVSHLILFGGYAAGWRVGTTKEVEAQREAVITLTATGWGQDNPAYRQIFSSTFLPSANKEELDWFNEYQRLTTSPKNAVRFLSVFSSIDVRAQLNQVKVPTLVIHSLGDQRVSSEEGRKIASMIPNAEFVGLESDGHLLLGREPSSKVFVNAIKEFISRDR